MSALAYCADWNCSAKASCKWAVGRSREYNAGLQYRTQPFDRPVGAEHCAAYVTDKPKPFLMPQAIEQRAVVK